MEEVQGFELPNRNSFCVQHSDDFKLLFNNKKNPHNNLNNLKIAKKLKKIKIKYI